MLIAQSAFYSEHAINTSSREAVLVRDIQRSESCGISSLVEDIPTTSIWTSLDFSGQPTIYDLCTHIL